MNVKFPKKFTIPVLMEKTGSIYITAYKRVMKALENGLIEKTGLAPATGGKRGRPLVVFTRNDAKKVVVSVRRKKKPPTKLVAVEVLDETSTSPVENLVAVTAEAQSNPIDSILGGVVA